MLKELSFRTLVVTIFFLIGSLVIYVAMIIRREMFLSIMHS